MKVENDDATQRDVKILDEFVAAIHRAGADASPAVQELLFDGAFYAISEYSRYRSDEEFLQPIRDELTLAIERFENLGTLKLLSWYRPEQLDKSTIEEAATRLWIYHESYGLPLSWYWSRIPEDFHDAFDDVMNLLSLMTHEVKNCQKRLNAIGIDPPAMNDLDGWTNVARIVGYPTTNLDMPFELDRLKTCFFEEVYRITTAAEIWVGRERLCQRSAHDAENEDQVPACLVTLHQIAAIINRSKRTIERYKDRMPEPCIHGGKGKPAEWAWSEIRPWLESEFKRKLPTRFPADQFIR